MPKIANSKSIQELDVAYQIRLSGLDEQLDSSEKLYASAFKKLYYHLYSNSNSSRSEKIMSDLSNLLLCKIVCERTNAQDAITKFLNKQGTANELFLPLLRKAFPHLITDDDKFYMDDKTLRYGLGELSGLSLQSASAHVMGEAFQALMGPRLRGDKGQFFTPKSLVKAIIAVLHPASDAKIIDPACGTGGFLVEAQAFQADNFTDLEKQQVGKFIGIDKDKDLCRLAEATLEIVAPERGLILNFNSLDIKTLMKLPESQSPFNADYVLTNPPFGAKIKITEQNILKQFRLGYKWLYSDSGWLQENQLRDAQDPQILFIELCIKLLKPGGQMGIVLPEGVFGNTNTGYVWDYIRSQGNIVALLDCPRTTFQPSTDTKTNVLFFEKFKIGSSSNKENSKKVWMAVALNCGHDRRGRTVKTNGDSYPDDYPIIGDSFKTRSTELTPWQYTEITDPYYLCPRYYDKSPLKELEKEAERLGAELISVREMVNKGFLKIRKGHEVGAESYGTGDIPFVRTSDISNYEISIDPTRSVSDEVYEKVRDLEQLAPNDILMVADGRYRIGRTAILHEHNYVCVVQSHLKIITVTPQSPIDAVELLYILNLPMIQHQIRNLVFIQSTLGSLGSRLNEIMIPLPKKNKEWDKTIGEFRYLVEGRSEFLKKLKEFEHAGYEL
ncbi:MAG: N-6 DNA methylase [Anaerolineaceae bacterium]|jgi:type I restriction enzyme M protein|nr:MAG: N-6 DNA methylase [Anaerolineaceae bacterium]